MIIEVKPEKKGKMYYLASPYSNSDPLIKEQRYLSVVYYGSLLTKMGYTLIEPIGMSVPASQKFDLPDGYEFWKERDRLFISRCDGIMVMQMPGVDESVGVQDEIKYAKSLGLPVYTVVPYIDNSKLIFGQDKDDPFELVGDYEYD